MWMEYQELARVGPGRAVEALDGDAALGIEIPLYTTLGAFSPCSDTMFSTANPDVASRNCSKVNSWNAGRSYASSSSVTMDGGKTSVAVKILRIPWKS